MEDGPDQPCWLDRLAGLGVFDPGLNKIWAQKTRVSRQPTTMGPGFGLVSSLLISKRCLGWAGQAKGHQLHERRLWKTRLLLEDLTSNP